MKVASFFMSVVEIRFFINEINSLFFSDIYIDKTLFSKNLSLNHTFIKKYLCFNMQNYESKQRLN